MIELFLQSTAEDDFNWPLAIFLVGFFIAMAVTVSVIAWQGLATWRARMSIAREEAYRKLAEDVAAMSQETAASLKTLQADMAEIRQRTAAMERLLREVE